MPYRVLIVGGSDSARAKLRTSLVPEFSVEDRGLAAQALELLRADTMDVMVLDLDLADMDSLSFLGVLRQTERGANLPVLVVGDSKSEDVVLRVFELGAEDYLAAPCDPRELAARLRAILRRNYQRLEHWGAPLSLGGIEIDPSSRLCLVHGRRVVLRPREFELLEILMRRAGRVLSRSYLLETVWGMASDAQTRAVDMIVSRVRAALGRRAGALVETVSKLGYCFTKTS